MLHCRIALLRRRIGINQQQLAEKLHISPSTVGMYEQGRRTPNVDILVQMSRIFNVSLDYLITGSEFTPASEKISIDSKPHNTPCCQCCYQKIVDVLRENMSPYAHRYDNNDDAFSEDIA